MTRLPLHRLPAVFLPLLLGAVVLAAPAPEARVDVDRLPESYRAGARRVLDGPSMVCELPLTLVQAREDVMVFLMDRLPLAAVLSRIYELGDYVVDELPGGALYLHDRKGLEAVFQVLQADGPGRTYRVKGFYKPPMLFRVWCEGMVRVEWRPAGEGTVEMWATIWLRLEDRVLHKVGQALSPVFSAILDDKSLAFIRTASRLAEEVQKDAGQVYRRAMANNDAVTDNERRLYRERFLDGAE